MSFIPSKARDLKGAARSQRLLGRRPEHEVNEDLEIHFEMLVEDYIARGMTPEEAGNAAFVRMGNLAAVREDGAKVQKRLAVKERVLASWHALAEDARFALRMFGRQKAWTSLSVITLGLGLGANGAMFSIVDAAVLRPLPFPQSGRVMSVSIATDGKDGEIVPDSALHVWQARARSFSVLAGYRPKTETFKWSGKPQDLEGLQVTEGYFTVYPGTPLLGRVLTAADDKPGAPRVVVLSELTWRHLYDGSPGIVGREITVGGNRTIVVGVMPAEFSHQGDAAFWEPLSQNSLPKAGQSVGPIKITGFTVYLSVVGRLAPRLTADAARDELQKLMPRTDDDRDHKRTVIVKPLTTRRLGESHTPLLMLFGAVGILMLVACANVAGLSLARAASRGREFAVRAAVGASSWRVARYVLCESVLLALMGAAVGLSVARLTLGLIVRLSPPSIAAMEGIAIDTRVVLFTFVVAVATAILFSIAPLLQLRRASLNTLLLDNSPRATGSRALFRRGLVVAQLAIALALVTGAGLLIKSFARVTSIPTVTDPAHVVVADLTLSKASYDDRAAARHFFDRFTREASAIPGVQEVALTSAAPLAGPAGTGSVTGPDGRPGPTLDVIAVSPNFFRTAGIDLAAGRPFTTRDGTGPEPVAILNETAARTFANPYAALGHRLSIGWAPGPMLVVGIARDTRQHGVESAAPAIMYVPLEQEGGPDRFTTVLARVDGNPAVIAPAIRDVVRRIDPSQRFPATYTLGSRLADAVAPRRFSSALLTAFASLGAVLAMIGLYGVMSHLVAERTGEIGVRIALGAQPGRIVRYIVGEGMGITAIGLALGLVGSLAGVRLIQSLLFQICAYDPAVFAAAAGLLVITALIACAVPARRALSIDPLDALRMSS